MRTISRMYDSYSDAAAVVHDLEAADLKPDREISLVANEDARGRDTAVEPTRTETKTGTGTGAGVGATVGGVVGNWRRCEPEEAEVYEEGVRRGHTLVSVRADETDIPRVEAILDRRPTTDWRARRDEYTAGGWQPSR